MKKFQRAYLEITNRCNLHCSFCPGTKQPLMMLDSDRFKERISKILPFTEQIFFHVLGEPLLHPDLYKFTEHCAQVHLPINITTNGFLLSEEKEQILLHPGIRQVNFSLQALTECSGSTDPMQILQRILRFCSKAEAERPDLYINLRTWDLSHDFKYSRLQSMLEKEICAFFQISAQTFSFSPGRKSRRLHGRIYWNADSRFEWPVSEVRDISVQTNFFQSVQPPDSNSRKPESESTEKRNPISGFCHGLESQFAVLVNGDVVPCCLDSEGILRLGNLDEQSLSEILSGPRARRIQEGFRHCQAIEPFCQTCSYRKRFDLSMARRQNQKSCIHPNPSTPSDCLQENHPITI